MQRITDLLDLRVAKAANKLAFSDENRGLSFVQLQTEAQKLASALLRSPLKHFCANKDQYTIHTKSAYRDQPAVAIFLPKSVECIASFLGVAYAGAFYAPLDIDMPTERIKKIIDALEPIAIVTDEDHAKQAKDFCGNAHVLLYEETQESTLQEADMQALKTIKDKASINDLLYVLFTSGSTGIPKGVMVEHKSVLAYVEWMTKRFDIDSSSVIASQTPFYFVMSVFDIYAALFSGASMHIVPKELFSFPVPLMEYLRKKRVNTLYWVPSALCAVAVLGALDEVYLNELRTVLFSGEVMPVKQLKRWIKKYPEVLFANIYGQTEAMDASAYYVVNRHFENSETLPIGSAVGFAKLYVIDEAGNEVLHENTESARTATYETEQDNILKTQSQGELCIAGKGLARGYIKDLKKTADAFVQNPLSAHENERIYKTGDIVAFNKEGELEFVTRKDFQIKHMGNRIELGEIESAAVSIEGVERACCLYNMKRKKIILFYVGKIERAKLKASLRAMLPDYMIPNKTRKIDAMPLNANGKIDRKTLQAQI